VDVAIASSTARAGNIGHVGSVEEDQTSTAREITRTDTNSGVATDRSTSNGVVHLLVHDNVVGTADWKLVPVGGEVILGEILW
jgi:hypothetical protein